MSRCKALSAARCVALVVLGAWLVGCGSDTTVVIASGTGNPQTDRSGGLVVAVRSGDPPPIQIGRAHV